LSWHVSEPAKRIFRSKTSNFRRFLATIHSGDFQVFLGNFQKSLFRDQSVAIGFILSGLRFNFPLFLEISQFHSFCETVELVAVGR